MSREGQVPGYRALLLDFGGVVQRSTLELLGTLADTHGVPAEIVGRRGPFGPLPDEDYERVLRGEIGERDYWTLRAKEVGGHLGQDWETVDLMSRVCDLPEDQLVRPEAAALIGECGRRGIRTGILTNDLTLFQTREWVDRQDILKRIDVMVDCSHTPFRKPDPQAYTLAVDTVGVPAGEIVYLDDIPGNVRGGSEAGLRAYQVDIAGPAAAFGAAAADLGIEIPLGDFAGP
jgi:putative hydrolase of the HAD superfamily